MKHKNFTIPAIDDAQLHSGSQEIGRASEANGPSQELASQREQVLMETNKRLQQKIVELVKGFEQKLRQQKAEIRNLSPSRNVR